jgi:hypothetical protein
MAADGLNFVCGLFEPEEKEKSKPRVRQATQAEYEELYGNPEFDPDEFQRSATLLHYGRRMSSIDRMVLSVTRPQQPKCRKKRAVRKKAVRKRKERKIEVFVDDVSV